MDVDCSSITYDTKPSPVIMTAVEKAKKEMEENLIGEVVPLGRTESANESLSNSLLTRMDSKTATDDELREAFCRDIDSFSFEMQVKLTRLFVPKQSYPLHSHVKQSQL